MLPKASGKTDLSIHPSHRVAGSNVPTFGAVNKPKSGARHPSADCGHSDSSPPSYGVASPLHFHGLAVTQTQTQVASCAEESGKGRTGSESRVAKRRKVAHDPNAHSSSGGPSRISNELSETRPKSRSISKLKRRRSPSVTSVDSFAEAEEWEDPAKVFLARNPQFEVPLSELGRGATRCSSTTRTPPEPTQIDLPRSPSPRRFPASGSRIRTKVQRTGDQNDDALSRVSDVSLDAPARNQSPKSDISDIPDEASTPPVMSNPGLLDHSDTQAEDYQATQPLAAEDLETATQVFDVSDSHARQSSPPARSSTNSRPSTNTRNILGMVNPLKPWRHQRGRQLQLQAASHSAPDEQTQPSVEFRASSHAASAGRRLFEELAAHMRAEQPSTPQDGPDGQNRPRLPVVDEDSHETVVVPDSEPSEPRNMSSTPAQPDTSSPPKASLHDRPVDSSLSRPARATPAAEQDDLSKHEKAKDGMIDDDDDDEEDIPLLLTVGRPATRFAPPSIKAGDPPKPKAGPSRVDGHAERAPGVKISRTRGIDTGDKEIPSSIPEQDRRSLAAPPRSLTQPRTGSRREGREREDITEDAFIPDASSDRLTPAPDEDTTEPADDLPIDSMDTGDDVHPPRDSKVPSNRKRPVSLRKAAYKSATRAGSKTPSMATAARAINRNNYHPMATRVFALWKQAAAYFSGVVYERVGQSDRFKIKFDDGDEDVLDVKNLRRLELQVGDRVSIIESQEKATTAKVDGQQHGFVTARLVDDPTTEFEVEVVGIKIQSRAIGSQWGNRVVNADEIVTLVTSIKTETPTSLRNSSTNLNKKKVLTKVGIVVTMSVGSDWEKEKEVMMRIIKTNGGTVLDDWSDVFSLAGEYSTNKKRWAITSDNVGLEMKHDIQQVFLVSDAANTKPRFLTALALGIPCLSVDWLRHLSSGQCAISDWPHYLLPAGYSDSLGARVTQMVDLDWGTTLDHLTGIMSNNVATKLFSKKSVLVLGPEYFPPPAKGKKGTSGVGSGRSGDGGQFIPRIIVSMGAARVEAVPELKYSSNPDLNDFQFVVVKDLHERPAVGGEKYVSMEWVKDCLIAGRMFPPRV